MILDITHKTVYKFDESPKYGLQKIRLTPKNQRGQSIMNWDVDFEGGNEEARFTDQYNNTTQLISIKPGVTQLIVTAKGQVDVIDQQGIIGPHLALPPLWLFLRSTPLTSASAKITAIFSLQRRALQDFRLDMSAAI